MGVKLRVRVNKRSLSDSRSLKLPLDCRFILVCSPTACNTAYFSFSNRNGPAIPAGVAGAGFVTLAATLVG